MISELGLDPENDVPMGRDGRRFGYPAGSAAQRSAHGQQPAGAPCQGRRGGRRDDRLPPVPQDRPGRIRRTEELPGEEPQRGGRLPVGDDHGQAVRQGPRPLATRSSRCSRSTTSTSTNRLREDYPADVNTLSADCGFEIPEMEKLWEEFGQTGEADPNIDWRSACDLEPMWEAQEAAGLPRRPSAL